MNSNVECLRDKVYDINTEQAIYDTDGDAPLLSPSIRSLISHE